MEEQKNLFGEPADPPGKKRRGRRPIPRAKYRGPLLPLESGGMGKLEKAFWKFHNANPKVYRLLVKFAFQWREARGGHSKLGMKALFERVRWETSLHTTEDENFKLNNNNTAFYARLIMDRNPDLADLFSLRKQRIASSIGPGNDTLPPGDHVA